jgi:hypothetical protein
LSPAFGDEQVYLMDAVSRPIRLSEGATRSRGILNFNDHPATTSLLGDVDPAKAEKQTGSSGMRCTDFLLMFAMFWPLL